MGSFRDAVRMVYGYIPDEQMDVFVQAMRDVVGCMIGLNKHDPSAVFAVIPDNTHAQALLGFALVFGRQAKGEELGEYLEALALRMADD